MTDNAQPLNHPSEWRSSDVKHRISAPPSEGHTASSSTTPRSAMRMCGQWFVSKRKALMRKPWWLCMALAVTACMIGFGVWGVVAASRSEESTRWTMAKTAAQEKALNMKTVLDGAFNPCVTMAMLIKQEPFSWAAVEHTYHKLAPDILRLTRSSSYHNTQLAPNAVVQAVSNDAFASAIGMDLLQEPSRRRDTLRAILANVITVAGPMMLVANIQGLVGRYPLFIDGVDVNETFGFGPPLPAPTTPPACCANNSCNNPHDLARWDACRPLDPPPGMGLYDPLAANCPLSTCYQSRSRKKFWGFTQVIVTWEIVKDSTKLYELCNHFDFIMTYTDGFGRANVPIAMCSDVIMIPTAHPGLYNGTLGPYQLTDYLPRQPFQLTFAAANNEWTLWIVDKRGWTPSWCAPLIAMAVVVSLLVLSLVLLLMASHLEQEQLLEEQLSINRQLAHTKAVLEAEKATTDALIMRQLNLIACFADETGAQQSKPQPKAERTSTEQQTLNRIEAVRRQVSSGQSKQDQVQILDMLGEGSFGKVYKGLWRGSEVAVKTIVLPANMSGAAKREKMAIMEAAISSSLAHPNVVQTYTYSIRPLRDSMTSNPGSSGSGHGSFLVTTGMQSHSWRNLQSLQVDRTQTMADDAGQIVSYEVQLVLEYCDRGCLKDALDAGVFFSGSGLNYKAILDTACDVAKAMVHLHLANVLHSDLKARNIMLKSSGQEGRGACAKVADFGLSISLDSSQTHMSSMFQGTLTHMAPELLMKGLASKAADVYAFGILLWEIITGSTPFSDVPGPHLGHAITALKKRPDFSMAVPAAYRQLAQDCWAHSPKARPTFQQVFQRLNEMRSALPGPTEPMPIAQPRKHTPRGSAGQTPGTSFFGSGAGRAGVGEQGLLGRGLAARLTVAGPLDESCGTTSGQKWMRMDGEDAAGESTVVGGAVIIIDGLKLV